MSALLLSLAFTKYNLGPLVLVGVVPLLMFLAHKSTKRLTVKAKIKHVWLAGFIFFLSVFSWMLATEPITWTPVRGTDSDVIKYMIYALMAGVYALSWLVLAYFAEKYQLLRQKNILKGCLLFAAAWILLEFARSYFFALLMYHPQATIGAHWNFGNLSFGAATTPLIYGARLVGTYGLSALVIAVNFVIFALITKQYRQSVILMVVVFVVVSAGFASYWPKTSQKSVNVASLQIKNYGMGDEYIDYLNSQLTDQTNKYDLIVMPEYSEFFEINKPEARKELLAKLVDDNTAIVTSEEIFHNDRVRTNDRKFFNGSGELLDQQTKTFLIPGGEYMPVWPGFFIKLAGHKALMNDFNDNNALHKGAVKERPFTDADGPVIGALVCSGSISPELYRQMANSGDVEILTNSASLGIFRDAATYHEQTQQMSRLHAVANAKPFVQSTRDGHSFIIDQQGRFLAFAGNDSEARIISAQLSVDKSKTVYTRFGEYILLLAAAVIGLFLYRNHKN